MIRGRVEFDNAVLEDFIIVRSSGVPMFHLANAYDDVDMGSPTSSGARIS